MKKSVLLQRFFMVVIMTLLMTSLFTGATYTYISRTLFVSIKSTEMLPKARALSRLIEKNAKNTSPETVRMLLDLFKEDESMLGGYFLVVDGAGQSIIGSSDITSDDIAIMGSLIERVLCGEEVTAYSNRTASRIQMVGVGTPVVIDGEISGAVLLFVPLYEAMAAVSGLNSALMLSLLIVMPLVVFLVYLVTGHIVSPLRQMRDVAMAMASGNFNAQADEEQRGEIGQLAASLNYLSRELSHNLSELTIERNRLRQSVDGLREGFVSVNSTGRITYRNPAVREMFSSSESEGRLSLIPDQGVWDAFDQAIARSEASVYDMTVGDRMIRATITPVTDEEGHTVGAVGLFSDITESERLERTRRDYVANVSHELRTPLTALRGLIEPLRDGMVRSEEARMRYYDIMLRETMRLSRLIDDLMELSRLQSGKLSLEMRRMALSTMIEDLADKYTATARDKNQTFRLLADPAACPDVIANPDRVEQILVILLDNAMKYTPEGGEISLDVRAEGEKAVLSVSDTGIGIAEEDLPYVFDRFYKADKSRTGSSGSGLGLSIAREILQWMGESISVRSEKGKGSVFSFTLRLDKKGEA